MTDIRITYMAAMGAEHQHYHSYGLYVAQGLDQPYDGPLDDRDEAYEIGLARIQRQYRTGAAAAPEPDTTMEIIVRIFDMDTFEQRDGIDYPRTIFDIRESMPFHQLMGRAK
jgi:hypothetical protein